MEFVQLSRKQAPQGDLFIKEIEKDTDLEKAFKINLVNTNTPNAQRMRGLSSHALARNIESLAIDQKNTPLAIERMLLLIAHNPGVALDETVQIALRIFVGRHPGTPLTYAVSAAGRLQYRPGLAFTRAIQLTKLARKYSAYSQNTADIKREEQLSIPGSMLADIDQKQRPLEAQLTKTAPHSIAMPVLESQLERLRSQSADILDMWGHKKASKRPIRAPDTQNTAVAENSELQLELHFPEANFTISSESGVETFPLLTPKTMQKMVNIFTNKLRARKSVSPLEIQNIAGILAFYGQNAVDDSVNFLLALPGYTEIQRLELVNKLLTNKACPLIHKLSDASIARIAEVCSWHFVPTAARSSPKAYEVFRQLLDSFAQRLSVVPAGADLSKEPITPEQFERFVVTGLATGRKEIMQDVIKSIALMCQILSGKKVAFSYAVTGLATDQKEMQDAIESESLSAGQNALPFFHIENQKVRSHLLTPVKPPKLAAGRVRIARHIINGIDLVRKSLPVVKAVLLPRVMLPAQGLTSLVQQKQAYRISNHLLISVLHPQFQFAIGQANSTRHVMKDGITWIRQKLPTWELPSLPRRQQQSVSFRDFITPAVRAAMWDRWNYAKKPGDVVSLLRHARGMFSPLSLHPLERRRREVRAFEALLEAREEVQSAGKIAMPLGIGFALPSMLTDHNSSIKVNQAPEATVPSKPKTRLHRQGGPSPKLPQVASPNQ